MGIIRCTALAITSAALLAGLASGAAAAKPGPPGERGTGELHPSGHLDWCLNAPRLQNGTILVIVQCAKGTQAKEL